jgi:hypothetical protein
MSQAIKVQQALHGYADGHQLLATSLKLNRDQHWQMLVMSDLSGPSFREGFESYITGYPILGGGYYCLARTWFAPELPRPGCVWTHTLLISDTDVARIGDFRALAAHWLRPTNDFERYNSELFVEPSTFGPFEIATPMAQAVLQELYSDAPRMVVVSTEASTPYEALVLAVLNQQWPRLRRSFRFSTGILSPTATDFDLIVTPPNAVRKGFGNQTDAALVSDSLASPATEWLQFTTMDLIAGDSQSELRQFLSRYGPDYPDGRANFRPLCEIGLVFLRMRMQPEHVLSVVAHYYPEADTSERLKSELFSQDSKFWTSADQRRSLLHTLVAHPAASCVPESVSALHDRAYSVTQSNTELAIEVASAALDVGGPRADRYISGFTAAASDRPGLLLNLPLLLALTVLRAYPRIVGTPELWKRQADEQLEIAVQFASGEHPLELKQMAVRAALGAQAWMSLAVLLPRFGADAVRVTLEWLDDTIPAGAIDLPDALRRALSEQREGLLTALSRSAFGACGTRIASILLDARATDVRRLGAKPWLPVAYTNARFRRPEDQVRSDAFIFAAGLSANDEDGARLVSASFSSVYEVARSASLDDQIWASVEAFLPWYSVSWDRCARLIKGVVAFFVSDQKPAEIFVSTFNSPEQFSRAINEAARNGKGRRYLRAVCSTLGEHQMIVEDYKSEMLSKYFD